jgi:co-chaperonin GroES (HSP10)
MFASPKEVEEIENEIDELARAAYLQHHRTFTPMHPWCFVRVLPKEQQLESGLILPAIEQNKTIHEGIILATWLPFNEERTTRDKDGKILTKVFQKQSQFKPGDHVLFPHWAGLPIAGFSDKHYRVIKEEDWKQNDEGGIFAIVDYLDKQSSPTSILRDVLGFSLDDWNRDFASIHEFVSLVAAKIEDRFLLVDRDRQSVTLSGR